MPGETDIMNVALRMVGQSTITSRGDGSTTANTLDDIYDEVRDDLLRTHPWDFAIKRVQLARSTTDPAFEFDYAYVLPADWLRTVSVHDNDAGYGTLLYRMEYVGTQRCIVASADAIYLRYVYQVTDPNLMTADFRRTLELSLARDLAIPLASSNKLWEQFTLEVRLALARSRSADAMGSFPELRPRGSWASSRGGGRNNEFFSD